MRRMDTLQIPSLSPTFTQTAMRLRTLQIWAIDRAAMPGLAQAYLRVSAIRQDSTTTARAIQDLARPARRMDPLTILETVQLDGPKLVKIHAAGHPEAHDSSTILDRGLRPLQSSSLNASISTKQQERRLPKSRWALKSSKARMASETCLSVVFNRL